MTNGREFTHEIYEDFYAGEFYPKYVDPFSPTYVEDAFPLTTEVDNAINLLSHELYQLGGSPILIYRYENGKPLGYAVYQTGYSSVIEANALDLFLLGTLSSEKGIGTRIVSELYDMAQGQNLEAITLTSYDNELIPFYLYLGFVEYPGKELGMIKRII